METPRGQYTWTLGDEYFYFSSFFRCSETSQSRWKFKSLKGLIKSIECLINPSNMKQNEPGNCFLEQLTSMSTSETKLFPAIKWKAWGQLSFRGSETFLPFNFDLLMLLKAFVPKTWEFFKNVCEKYVLFFALCATETEDNPDCLFLSWTSLFLFEKQK